MKLKRKQKPLLFLAVLMFMIALPFGSADAMHFEFGDDFMVDADVTLSYGAGIRVKDPHPKNIADPNLADDGNRNFDQWDLINSRFNVVVDIDLQYKNIGYFIRPKAFYDFVYMTDNANDSPLTNNALAAGLIQENDEWSSEVKKVHGRNVELLDYFAYGNFEIGNFLVDVRVGNQVIQWGESLYISGIAGAMAHVDAVAATSPGTSIKEILLPSQGAQLSVDITDNLVVGGFYQWEWDHTKYYEGGSFFNYQFDVVDHGGKALIIVPGFNFLSRTDDFEPEDEGQYGVKVIYRAGQALNMTEFGLYYIYYHPKTALDAGLTFTAPFNTPGQIGTYLGVYWEGVDVYALSFSSQIGEANVSGEVSYYQGWPIETKAGGWTGDGTFTISGGSNYTGDDFVQAQVSAIYIYTPPSTLKWLFESATLAGETGLQYVTDIDSDNLVGDKFAWSVSLRCTPLIVNILPGIDMRIPLAFNWDVNGATGLGAAAGNFAEGTNSASGGLSFNIYKDYNFSIRYAEYWDKTRMGLNDRTNISCNFRYSF